jgi:hypothetical protein
MSRRNEKLSMMLTSRRWKKFPTRKSRMILGGVSVRQQRPQRSSGDRARLFESISRSNRDIAQASAPEVHQSVKRCPCPSRPMLSDLISPALLRHNFDRRPFQYLLVPRCPVPIPVPIFPLPDRRVYLGRRPGRFRRHVSPRHAPKTNRL